ncbi:unnamed protein product [Echinostoma caproni]|uniref:Terpene_synth_C domain-containing protein n=1 Tax=Echinostoma caproni TaxID=27848 RepID=A0A183AZA1_9TREM|nr:unnamed protein product [Echinostoma caproni]
MYASDADSKDNPNVKNHYLIQIVSLWMERGNMPGWNHLSEELKVGGLFGLLDHVCLTGANLANLYWDHLTYG